MAIQSAAGFVASLARPGGNITGPIQHEHRSREQAYLELLRAAVPKLSRVTVLVNPGNPIHPDFLKRIQATENEQRKNLAGSSEHREPDRGRLQRDEAGARGGADCAAGHVLLLARAPDRGARRAAPPADYILGTGTPWSPAD